MLQDRVDGFLVAVNDVEDAIGQARFLEQLGHVQREARIALGWLQDERVAARDRHREHPHRDHRRKVEWRDPGTDPHGLADRPAVHVGADVLAELALEEVRNAARELDDLDATRDRPFRIGERLAVLFGDHPRELFLVRFHEFAKTHENPRAAQRRCCPPRGQGRTRCAHRRIDVLAIAERDVADDLAGRRIGDLAIALRARRDGGTADPERQAVECGEIHGRFSDCCGPAVRLFTFVARIAGSCVAAMAMAATKG